MSFRQTLLYISVVFSLFCVNSLGLTSIDFRRVCLLTTDCRFKTNVPNPQSTFLIPDRLKQIAMPFWMYITTRLSIEEKCVSQWSQRLVIAAVLFDFCYSHMDFVRLFLYCSPCWHYEYVLHCFCIIFGWFVVILYNIDFSMKLCMFFGMHHHLLCFTFPHTILDLWASAQSD